MIPPAQFRKLQSTGQGQKIALHVITSSEEVTSIDMMIVDPATVPVLLLGFNRPDKLLRAMEPLRLVKPRQVFIAVDGPRENRPEEAGKCLETQNAAQGAIDWKCTVRTLFRERNLGCRRAVSEAISWALQEVEELIIIEDDCVVDPSFFRMCRVLLDRHRNDDQVYHIAASNFQEGQWRGDGAYYASKYAHCWGWATWRRAWRGYTDDLSVLEKFCESEAFIKRHPADNEREYWRHAIALCRSGEVDSWAYRWTLSCWLNGAVTLLPNVNLVSNIGFDAEGTHTKDILEAHKQERRTMEDFPAPSTLEPDVEADRFSFEHIFCPPGSLTENIVVKRRLKKARERAKEVETALTTSQKELKRWSEWQTWAKKHPFRAAWRVMRGRRWFT